MESTSEKFQGQQIRSVNLRWYQVQTLQWEVSPQEKQGKQVRRVELPWARSTNTHFDSKGQIVQGIKGKAKFKVVKNEAIQIKDTYSDLKFKQRTLTSILEGVKEGSEWRWEKVLKRSLLAAEICP